MQIKRILATIELTTIDSNSSSATLEAALSLAVRYGSDLLALNVIDDPLVEAEKHVYPVGDDDLIERNEAQVQLDRLIKRTIKKLAVQHPITILVESGKSEDVLLKVVQQQQIDMLVVGHRPEWRIEHLLFGRILDHIVAKSSCAVLVIPEPIPNGNPE
jgi:nucleotide-binding universal stress UspA family protein